MLDTQGLRYLASAEVLALIATCICWLRVWVDPSPGRIRIAALSSAAVLMLQAFTLSLAIANAAS